MVGTLPDMPVVELVRRVRAQPEPPRVVLLLGRVAPDAIAELLSLDVEGLVPRSIDGAGLVGAVQRVRRGERVVDPGILVTDATADVEAEEASALTAREREVLVLLAAGHSNREIASSLYVSLPTVKTHLAHIYAKLGAKNRNEALGRESPVAGGLCCEAGRRALGIVGADVLTSAVSRVGRLMLTSGGPAFHGRSSRVLVLTRRSNQSIMIGHDIVVTVLEVRGEQVRIGIKAPREVEVHREEVFDALHESEASRLRLTVPDVL